MEEELSKGKSLAAKVMADIFKRQQAAEVDGEAKRVKEHEEHERERVRQQEIEFERAI